jgi:hypothetical protein
MYVWKSSVISPITFQSQPKPIGTETRSRRGMPDLSGENFTIQLQDADLVNK